MLSPSDIGPDSMNKDGKDILDTLFGEPNTPKKLDSLSCVAPSQTKTLLQNLGCPKRFQREGAGSSCVIFRDSPSRVCVSSTSSARGIAHAQKNKGNCCSSPPPIPPNLNPPKLLFGRRTPPHGEREREQERDGVFSWGSQDPPQ